MIYDLLAIASYVLMALGLYTVAKRRGIHKAWLAWIPVANVWLLGCISDQYRQVAKGQVKNRRKLLLTLQIVVVVLAILVSILAVSWVTGLVLSSDVPQQVYDALLDMSTMNKLEMMERVEGLVDDLFDSSASDVIEYMERSVGLLFALAGLALTMAGLAIWLSVVQYMAIYDLFAAAEPKNATIYFVLGLILSLLGFGIAMSLLVFICKDKDLGMPSRGTVYRGPEF